jgi:hypothetical protein
MSGRGSYYTEEEIARLLEHFGPCPLDGCTNLRTERNEYFRPELVCGRCHHLSIEHYAAAHLGLRLDAALAWLGDFLGRTDLVMPEEPILLVPQAVEPLDAPVDFSPVNAYWTGRGVPEDVQTTFDMGTVDGLPGALYRQDGIVVGWSKRDLSYAENQTVERMGTKYQINRMARRCLWGESQALALGQAFFIVCEGIMDAVRCQQAGLPAVAVSAPCPTVTQLLRLRQITETLIFCPDQDTPGGQMLSAPATRCMTPFFDCATWSLPVKDAALLTPAVLLAEFQAAFPGRLK